jgi:hypothetical protein
MLAASDGTELPNETHRCSALVSRPRPLFLFARSGSRFLGALTLRERLGSEYLWLKILGMVNFVQ